MNLRLLLLLLLPISLFSCKKGGEDAHDAEMRKLNAWILVNNITVAPTASGMYFIPVKEGSGATPIDRDYIQINYTIQLLDGTIVYATQSDISDTWGLEKKHFVPELFQVVSNPIKLLGLVEAVKMMKVGGKAHLILPSNLAFGSAGFGGAGIGSNTSIIVDVELVKVIGPDITSYGKTLVDSYANVNGLTLTIPDKAGIYYKNLTELSTKQVGDSASTVKVWYVGRYLDGVVFDTNIDTVATNAGITASSTSMLSVTFGKNGVIPAFEEVLKKMWKSEKTKFVTTPEFAYGAAGSGKIPPYTPLVFEITMDTTFTMK